MIPNSIDDEDELINDNLNEKYDKTGSNSIIRNGIFRFYE